VVRRPTAGFLSNRSNLWPISSSPTWQWLRRSAPPTRRSFSKASEQAADSEEPDVSEEQPSANVLASEFQRFVRQGARGGNGAIRPCAGT
jgi:hypothetical protein